MYTRIGSYNSLFTIAKADMPRAASLLPERYRDASKSPLEQVACALRDGGLDTYPEDGAIEELGCEWRVLHESAKDVLAALAPVVEDGSHFTYVDDDLFVPYGFFFHDGVCEFKEGSVLFD